jgi:hypothetical protein
MAEAKGGRAVVRTPLDPMVTGIGKWKSTNIWMAVRRKDWGTPLWKHEVLEEGELEIWSPERRKLFFILIQEFTTKVATESEPLRWNQKPSERKQKPCVAFLVDRPMSTQ